MARSYTPGDVITLPRVSIKEGAALAAALINRGRSMANLPPTIDRALGQVQAENAALNNALDERLAGPSTDLLPSDADRDIDGAWRSAYHWSKGWLMIPYHPELVAKARVLHETLFPNGLKFINQPYRDEWVESKTRVERIDKEQLAPLFTALGGDAILQAIRQAQEAYGKALGITQASDSAPMGAVALGRVMEAIRRYVLKVAAHVELDDPASQKLADDLLQPLIDWEYRQTPAPEDSEPEDPKPEDPEPCDEPPATKSPVTV